MSELNAFAFIYENLITLTEYGEGTRLCTFEPKKTLYVVKKVPLSAASVMRKLAELSSPRLARIFYVAENEEEGFAEAVCEYVGGEALTEYLRRLPGVVDRETLGELCSCDDGIGYFDYSDCLYELIGNGLVIEEKDGYRISEKGASVGETVESSLPFSVL